MFKKFIGYLEPIAAVLVMAVLVTACGGSAVPPRALDRLREGTWATQAHALRQERSPLATEANGLHAAAQEAWRSGDEETASEFATLALMRYRTANARRQLARAKAEHGSVAEAIRSLEAESAELEARIAGGSEVTAPPSTPELTAAEKVELLSDQVRELLEQAIRLDARKKARATFARGERGFKKSQKLIQRGEHDKAEPLLRAAAGDLKAAIFEARPSQLGTPVEDPNGSPGTPTPPVPPVVSSPTPPTPPVVSTPTPPTSVGQTAAGRLLEEVRALRAEAERIGAPEKSNLAFGRGEQLLRKGEKDLQGGDEDGALKMLGLAADSYRQAITKSGGKPAAAEPEQQPRRKPPTPRRKNPTRVPGAL